MCSTSASTSWYDRLRSPAWSAEYFSRESVMIFVAKSQSSKSSIRFLCSTTSRSVWARSRKNRSCPSGSAIWKRKMWNLRLSSKIWKLHWTSLRRMSSEPSKRKRPSSASSFKRSKNRSERSNHQSRISWKFDFLHFKFLQNFANHCVDHLRILFLLSFPRKWMLT